MLPFTVRSSQEAFRRQGTGLRIGWHFVRQKHPNTHSARNRVDNRLILG